MENSKKYFPFFRPSPDDRTYLFTSIFPSPQTVLRLDHFGFVVLLSPKIRCRQTICHLCKVYRIAGDICRDQIVRLSDCEIIPYLFSGLTLLTCLINLRNSCLAILVRLDKSSVTDIVGFLRSLEFFNISSLSPKTYLVFGNCTLHVYGGKG